MSPLRCLSVLPLNIYYGTTQDDYIVRMTPTSDGGFVLAGTTDYNGAPDILVIKINSSGSLQWARTIEGAADDISNTVI